MVGGLHLGESPVEVRRLLRGHLCGIQILLLEVDGNAQPEQLPHELDVFPGVPRKPGDGLDQQPVNFSGPAVIDHAVEVVPFLGLRACEPLVGIDVHHLPVLLGGDVFGVEVHLGDVGVELIL